MNKFKVIRRDMYSNVDLNLRNCIKTHNSYVAVLQFQPTISHECHFLNFHLILYKSKISLDTLEKVVQRKRKKCSLDKKLPRHNGSWSKMWYYCIIHDRLYEAVPLLSGILITPVVPVDVYRQNKYGKCPRRPSRFLFIFFPLYCWHGSRFSICMDWKVSHRVRKK